MAKEKRSSQAQVASQVQVASEELANNGYCSSKNTFFYGLKLFYGVKLHVMADRRDSQWPLPDVAGGQLYGDKAYCDPAPELHRRGHAAGELAYRRPVGGFSALFPFCVPPVRREAYVTSSGICTRPQYPSMSIPELAARLVSGILLTLSNAFFVITEFALTRPLQFDEKGDQ
jgi:hypothetical protein